MEPNYSFDITIEGARFQFKEDLNDFEEGAGIPGQVRTVIVKPKGKATATEYGLIDFVEPFTGHRIRTWDKLYKKNGQWQFESWSRNLDDPADPDENFHHIQMIPDADAPAEDLYLSRPNPSEPPILDLPPVLRQTVKTQTSANGELSHGINA